MDTERTEEGWERHDDPDAIGLRPDDPGDDEGAMSEDEYAAENPSDDPPERDDPLVEPTHPDTTPEGGA